MEISTTLGLSRQSSGVYRPTSIQQLENEFTSIKEEHSSISMISCGKNWGYGCHAPNNDNDFIIDLSLCQKIIEFDPYHGTVTIEPGVTYGQLAQFLKLNGPNWVAPVHGGGPDTSVLGNSLERGYGITPFTDHFGSLLSLRAILANGDIYEGALKKLGLPKLDKLFKYGIGPYYDGLFSQSGIGIVTEVTIKLAPRPNYVEMFYFMLKDEADLEATIEAIKKSKKEIGSSLGGINLMNRERCLSMTIDYPLHKIQSGEPLNEDEINQYALQYKISSWLVVGMLYGEKEIVKASKQQLKKRFSHINKQSFYFNSTNKFIIDHIGASFKKMGFKSIHKTFKMMSDAYDILQGIPNQVALKLAYWKNEDKELVNQTQLDPNRDGCGLIWYAPLVELKGQNVLDYINFVKESSKRFNINPLITLTTIDDLCFDSTVPILFNRKCKKDTENAHKYYEYLLEEGAKKGFFPYRLNIETQKKFNIQNSFFKIATINPNRYK